MKPSLYLLWVLLGRKGVFVAALLLGLTSFGWLAGRE